MKKQLRPRLLVMMIPLTLLFVFVVQSAYGADPTKKLLTLSFNKTPLATALKTVEKESGCKVLFTYDEVQAYRVTATVKKEPLTHAMTAILKGLPFQYKLNGNFVIVSKNAQAAFQPAKKAAGNKVFGVIVDEEGEPLIGVTVRIKGTGKGLSPTLMVSLPWKMTIARLLCSSPISVRRISRNCLSMVRV